MILFKIISILSGNTIQAIVGVFQRLAKVVLDVVMFKKSFMAVLMSQLQMMGHQWLQAVKLV
jgi:hypothetical protein